MLRKWMNEFAAINNGQMCVALGVSRSSLHAWLTRAPTRRARDDEVIGSRIGASHVAGNGPTAPAESGMTCWSGHLLWPASGRAAHAGTGTASTPSPSGITKDLGECSFIAVIDLFSRRAVGWSISNPITTQLVTATLIMAISRRGKPDVLLHHSDQGSQCASEQFQRLMTDNGVTCSMRRSGNVWDNAAIKSFVSIDFEREAGVA